MLMLDVFFLPFGIVRSSAVDLSKQMISGLRSTPKDVNPLSPYGIFYSEKFRLHFFIIHLPTDAVAAFRSAESSLPTEADERYL